MFSCDVTISNTKCILCDNSIGYDSFDYTTTKAKFPFKSKKLYFHTECYNKLLHKRVQEESDLPDA